jgi:hypothetical protein
MPTSKPTKYVARIYGFKIFGRKGSKYEGMALPPGEEKKVEEKEAEKEKDMK